VRRLRQGKALQDMLRPEDVAEAVLFAVTRPARVAVTEIRLLPGIYAPRG